MNPSLEKKLLCVSLEGLKADPAAGLWGLGDSSLVLSIHTSRPCVSPLALKGLFTLTFFDWDTLQPKANTQQDCPGHRASTTNQSNSLQAKSQREACGPGCLQAASWEVDRTGRRAQEAIGKLCSDTALPSPNQKDKKQTAAGGCPACAWQGEDISHLPLLSVQPTKQIPFRNGDNRSVIFPEPQSHRGAKT